VDSALRESHTLPPAGSLPCRGCLVASQAISRVRNRINAMSLPTARSAHAAATGARLRIAGETRRRRHGHRLQAGIPCSKRHLGPQAARLCRPMGPLRPRSIVRCRRWGPFGATPTCGSRWTRRQEGRRYFRDWKLIEGRNLKSVGDNAPLSIAQVWRWGRSSGSLGLESRARERSRASGRQARQPDA